MRKRIKKSVQVNNSSQAEQKKPDTFSNILARMDDYGVSVVYVFISERYNIKENKSYKKVSKKVSQLTPAIFLTETGNRRTAEQVKAVLKDTARDLGASSFYIQ